jgi:trehalose/maltose transport system permease protein
MTRAQRRVGGRVLFYILLAIICLYLVFPFYWAIRSSITPDNQLFSTPVVYWPEVPTLINYQLVLSSPNFIRALGNSAVVATVVTLLSLVIGVLAAYALGRCCPRCLNASARLVSTTRCGP